MATAGDVLPSRRYAFEERRTCPACRSSDVAIEYRCGFAELPISDAIERLYHVDPCWLQGGEYRLDRCSACGLLYQGCVGGSALLSDLYTYWVQEVEDPERDFPLYRQDVRHPFQSRDGHELMAASAFLGIPIPEMRALDYGMGWALWGRIAAALGCRAFGSDLAEPRMEFARAHGIAAVTDEEIAGLSFHFINTEQVLEHVTEPWELVRRLAATLVPGGILKVSVPSQRGVDALIRQLNEGSWSGNVEQMMPVQPLEHVNCFTPTSIAALSAQHGLRVVRPRLRHLYAFLGHRGGIDLFRPKKAMKEIIRPIYQYRNPANLYLWLQRPLY